MCHFFFVVVGREEKGMLDFEPRGPCWWRGLCRVVVWVWVWVFSTYSADVESTYLLYEYRAYFACPWRQAYRA